MKFYFLFALSFRTDWRLSFLNLKTDSMSNLLNDDEKQIIWIPNIIFYNNPETNYVKIDPLTTLYIQKEGQPENGFNFTLNEYQQFKGSENGLVYENMYELKFHCELELHFYPFDTQHCFLNVRHFIYFSHFSNHTHFCNWISYSL